MTVSHAPPSMTIVGPSRVPTASLEAPVAIFPKSLISKSNRAEARRRIIANYEAKLAEVRRKIRVHEELMALLHSSIHDLRQEIKEETGEVSMKWESEEDRW